MDHRFTFIFIVLLLSNACIGQTSYDSLKQQILSLETRVDKVELNLEQSKNKFKSGILIATIGYTTTIAGGLMLGRSNDQMGQALLVAGGVTGVIGTYKLVDAFSYLTGRKKKKRY
ncbi:MAG: hypothetical protein Tsb0034_01160 [Ekhidna sp.]